MQAAAVLRALRADADFWQSAATAEQRAQIEGPRAPDLRREAIFVDTPEGQEALRQEKDRQLAEYVEHWGSPPA